MKAVAGTLKIDLAQFRDLEAFATFGSELDKVSQAQLDRGYRLTEILKQRQNAPVPVDEQVLTIYAGTNGWVDDIPVVDVQRFGAELIQYVKSSRPTLLERIRSSGELPPRDELDDAIASFKRVFAPSGDAPVPAASATASSEATDEAVSADVDNGAEG
jgi:F-type H+-transporting ATPase subunit alpha